MTSVIIVDLLTLAHPDTRESTKNVVIEHVVKHPDTLIAVLNGLPGTADMSKDVLAENQFPYDTIVDNPLGREIPPIVFKTMFAAKSQHSAPEDYRTVLVIDKDNDALQMWQSSGVQFTFNPLPTESVHHD